ncbi:MAG: hypothetical protein ACFBSD_13170 [Paracoccaceae bacterium]
MTGGAAIRTGPDMGPDTGPHTGPDMGPEGAFPELPGLMPALLGPLREIVELKRIRRAGRSLAALGFARSWAGLAAGRPPAEVALSETAEAVAALTLGGVDAEILAAAGLAEPRIAEIRRDAIRARRYALGPAVTERLSAAAPARVPKTPPPAFCARLEAEPRAGATFPGKPRLAPPLPENHAEHCWVTGVLTVLLLGDGPDAPDDAVGEAWLLAMAHHLHNAWLPDGGYAAEMALGADLEPVLAACTERALGDLSEALQARVRGALAGKDDVGKRAGAAFTAADAIDRVLELEAWETALGFRLDVALGDRQLVHPGPLQAFQTGALAALGLVPQPEAKT